MAIADQRAALPLSLITPPGPVPYDEAYELMHDLAARRARGEVSDTLILLEHPPVYTAGRRWKPEHLVWAENRMKEAGADLRFIDRGGSVTFHGPGQLVGYPILDLGPRPDVMAYVRSLEEVVIRACGDAGVRGLGRNAVNSGVWAGDRKVCAIGVKLTHARVTLHGFAVNCTTDLTYFDAIVPCGLADRGVISLSELAGREVTVAEAAPLVVRHFGDVFEMDLRPAALRETSAPPLPVP
jgi:lipoyl(octanoyl) transferase